tara:strand:- start:2906 stop:3496 length:591 start_codon:yes stop_codon:yes gene_type:complete
VVKVAVIGLGNPGLQYESTRHNVGFWLIDQFAGYSGASFSFKKKYNSEIVEVVRNKRKILLIKPLSFMNDSGKHLKSLLSLSGCDGDNVILLHDEITLPLSALKISHGQGNGGHNGVKSVLQALGSPLTRMRIGIGEKKIETQNLADYVLSKFSVREKSRLDERKAHFINGLTTIIDDGVDKAMNFFNQEKLIPTT